MYTTIFAASILFSIAPTISAQQLSLPTARYQQEIIFSDRLLSGETSLTRATPGILPLTASSSEIPIEFGFQQQAAGISFRLPSSHAVNLFTPNTVQQPAETPGQFENYVKALQEEAREAEREENAIISRVFGGATEGVRRRRPKSYVSVNMGEGAKGFSYGYSLS